MKWPGDCRAADAEVAPPASTFPCASSVAFSCFARPSGVEEEKDESFTALTLSALALVASERSDLLVAVVPRMRCKQSSLGRAPVRIDNCLGTFHRTSHSRVQSSMKDEHTSSS